MKKLFALLLAVLLTLSVAQAASIEDIAVGMSRTYIKSLIAAQGETVTFEDDDTLYVEGKTMYLNVSFYPDPDTADWINLSMAGHLESPFDLTRPDWTLTLEDALRTLRSGGIAYELFISNDGDPTIYCDALFCGSRLTMRMMFSSATHLLNVVGAELYNNESAITWAARMGHVLGDPFTQRVITEELNGPSTNLNDTLTWSFEGNAYALGHRILTYRYMDGEEPAMTWESRLVIQVTRME